MLEIIAHLYVGCYIIRRRIGSAAAGLAAPSISMLLLFQIKSMLAPFSMRTLAPFSMRPHRRFTLLSARQ